MVGVGFRKGRKITLEVSFDNDSLESAVAMGESMARHNKKEVIVFLYTKDRPKVKVLKRIKAVRAGFMWLGKKVVAT